MFKRILAAAALSGLVAGLVITVLQQVGIEPMIRAAEVREAATAAAARATAPAASASHAHPPAWSPSTPLQRVGSTLLANVTMTIGFALIIGAAMSIRGHDGWQRGLLWGVAGFAVVFVAPSLALPPELPGTELAPLAIRTQLWLTIVTTTAAGLAALAFARTRWLRLLGLMLIVAPHAMGTHSQMPALVDSGEGRDFIVATTIVNAIGWCVLGGISGWMLRRLHRAT